MEARCNVLASPADPSKVGPLCGAPDVKFSLIIGDWAAYGTFDEFPIDARGIRPVSVTRRVYRHGPAARLVLLDKFVTTGHVTLEPPPP